jgi:hypothetical protein
LISAGTRLNEDAEWYRPTLRCRITNPAQGAMDMLISGPNDFLLPDRPTRAPLPSKLNDKNAPFMHKGASRTEMAMNADMYSSARYGREQVPGRLDQTVIDEGLRQHMLRVYNYMGWASY